MPGGPRPNLKTCQHRWLAHWPARVASALAPRRLDPWSPAAYGEAVGDNFQIIADVEAAEAEAPALAASVVNWLASAGIIAGDPADCVLGTGPGYPPGPHYAAAVTSPDGMLASLWTNGVEVHTTRTVFHPVQGEMGPGRLPAVPAGIRPQRLAVDRRLADRGRLPGLHLLELACTEPVVHHPGRSSPRPSGCRHPGQALAHVLGQQSGPGRPLGEGQSASCPVNADDGNCDLVTDPEDLVRGCGGWPGRWRCRTGGTHTRLAARPGRRLRPSRCGARTVPGS